MRRLSPWRSRGAPEGDRTSPAPHRQGRRVRARRRPGRRRGKPARRTPRLPPLPRRRGIGEPARDGARPGRLGARSAGAPAIDRLPGREHAAVRSGARGERGSPRDASPSRGFDSSGSVLPRPVRDGRPEGRLGLREALRRMPQGTHAVGSARSRLRRSEPLGPSLEALSGDGARGQFLVGRSARGVAPEPSPGPANGSDETGSALGRRTEGARDRARRASGRERGAAGCSGLE